MTKSERLLIVAIAIAVSGATTGVRQAFAESLPIVATAAPATSTTPRDNFRARMQDFSRNLDTLAKNLETARGKFDDASKATPDQKRLEMQEMREKVREFGKMLADGSPLFESINRFDAWCAAQIGRLNNNRENLGQEWVEKTIGRYRAMQKDVTEARQMVANGSSLATSLLKEMVTTELRASELLMADEAEEALAELKQVMEHIEKTMLSFREQLRSIGGTEPDA